MEILNVAKFKILVLDRNDRCKDLTYFKSNIFYLYLASKRK